MTQFSMKESIQLKHALLFMELPIHIGCLRRLRCNFMMIILIISNISFPLL